MSIRKCPEAFSETQIDDEHVLMVLASGEFLSLAGTGGEIWRLIDGERDEEGLVALLAAQFDAARETIAADVAAFLARLEKRGLIVRA